MITDNTIDETTAKYWCAFADGKLLEILKRANTAAKDKTKSNVIAACVKTTQNAVNENWLTDFLTAKPAWVEEPTGFADVSPEGVFKNDVEGGVRGYNKGTALGAAIGGATVAGTSIASAAAALGAVNAAVKTAGKVATATGKAAGKAAKATGKTAGKIAKVAVNNPTVTVATGAALMAANELDKKGWLDYILDWCKKIGGFVKDHPVAIGTFGSIAYGLLKTYSLWQPYVRRLCYSITAGDRLAVCEFESNEKSYAFEYSLKKNKWVLLCRGKISDEIQSFVQTEFARRFVGRCREILEPALSKAAILKSMAGGCGDKNACNILNNIANNADTIRANMFKVKILMEGNSK